MSSSIKLRWSHAVFHYFLINLYNIINATYSYANKTSVYSGFDWYSNAFLTAGLTALLGPIYFGSYYVYILLMGYKDAIVKEKVVTVAE
jgi:hypothetical protein